MSHFPCQVSNNNMVGADLHNVDCTRQYTLGALLKTKWLLLDIIVIEQEI